MSEKFEVKDGLRIPAGKKLELRNAADDSLIELAGISNDENLASASSAELVTEFAVKNYVDSNNQWTLSDGVSSTVVDTGNTLTINGTGNEVNVEVDHNNDAFSIGLPNSVNITTDLAVSTLNLGAGSITDDEGAISFGDENLSTTGTLAAGATTITGNLTASGELTVGTIADATSMASATAPTDDAHVANKKYVDDQLGSTAMSAATDDGNLDPIDLDSETLSFLGGEAMDVTHSGNTITFAPELASETNLGVATFDGTDFSVTSGGDVTVNAERVQDIIGAMVVGDSAQSGISVSYDDTQNVLDFNVADPSITISGDVSGQATMTNLGDVTIAVDQQPNSVDLTTHTTGNYVATVAGGTGLSTTGSDGEGATHSLSVDTAQNHILSATSLSAVGTITTGTWNATQIATAYIADDAVTLDKMDSLSAAHFILGNDSDNPTAVTMSGDAEMANDGAVTITAGAVENSMLAGSIANDKLVNSTLSAGGVEFTLGSSVAQPAFDLTSAASYPGDSSLVTTGALASGSIASGFGTITTLSACDLGATTVDSMDVSNGGITQAGSIAGATDIDGSGDLTIGTITMTDFTVNATGLATMLSGSQLSSSSSAAVVADADIANKAYVDSVVSGSDLDFTIDGTSYDLDLDSQSIAISGTANEIEITDSEADDVISLQLGLPSDVTIGNDLDVTADLTCATITNSEFTVLANGNTDIDGTLNVEGVPTFQAESVHSSGIDCNGQLSMETNDIVGTADNMLLQADDETAHTFTGTDKMALQALSGIEMVNNVKFSADIESNIIPDADSTRSLGDANNHWSATYSDEVVLEHGKTTSFSVQPASAAAEKVMSFAHASFKSAKVTMNVKSGDNYTAREVLIVCKDDGTSPKLVEYGILSTDSELGTLSVAVNGNDIELKVASASGMPCTGVVTLSE